MHEEEYYRAISSRDSRFDGHVYAGVTSTGIYCRPSCPAVTPKRENLRFFRSAAAAQAAGFRACKRCRPDASPGSPEWDIRGDSVGRAVRLIADGVVDRTGVGGLASSLGYSERQLHRILTAELGAGPLALARARRAQTARILIETTELPMGDIAFAAGFASIRQFNDTVRAVFAQPPTELRRQGHRSTSGDDRVPGMVTLRLPFRTPYDAARTLRFLADRAVPGVEEYSDGVYRRVLRLPHGTGVVEVLPGTVREGHLGPGMEAGARQGIGVDGLRQDFDSDERRLAHLDTGSGSRAGSKEPWPEAGTPPEAASHSEAMTTGSDALWCRVQLDSLQDLATAVQRCRRLLDLDADPTAIADTLGAWSPLAPLLRRVPGLRSPGHVDPVELAVRAVIGQQVSVPAARTLTGRLVASYGTPLGTASGGLTHAFPAPEPLAEADPGDLPVPRSRGRALVALCQAIATGDLDLGPGADRDECERALRALPGIGPWTASYIRMRALGDPDVFLVTDLGVRQALERVGCDARPAAARELVRACAPFRSYATHHLWAARAAASDGVGRLDASGAAGDAGGTGGSIDPTAARGVAPNGGGRDRGADLTTTSGEG